MVGSQPRIFISCEAKKVKKRALFVMIYLFLNRFSSFRREAPKTIIRNKAVLEAGRPCYFAVSPSLDHESELFTTHKKEAIVIDHPVGRRFVRNLKILTA